MKMNRLRSLLEAAARGSFPPADFDVEVLPAPAGASQAVVAFSGHNVIAADVEPALVRAQLPSGDPGAPMSAPFLTWLGESLGAVPGMLDVVLSAPYLDDPPSVKLLPRPDLGEHPRAVRARAYRSDVSIFADDEERAVVMIGRGLAGRLEMSLDVAADFRGKGFGRAAIRAARALVPEEDHVFAQVSPGNVASVRAFLAAGFTPIGSEVLFLRTR